LRCILKNVFHYDSPREWYVCDAAVVSCFDNRFDLGFRKFLNRIGVTNPDHIKVAGGVKYIASPDSEDDRKFVLDQIRKSVSLHGTRRVILASHSDCGAYGRLEGFHGDHNAEARHHQHELAVAAASVLKAFPGLEVHGYFVAFDAIWDAEIDHLPLASGQ
jgi:carbonic anhydrase